MEVWFGSNLRGGGGKGGEGGVYEGFRRRWRGLVEERRRVRGGVVGAVGGAGKDRVGEGVGMGKGEEGEVGVLRDEELKFGREAEMLRREVAEQVRRDVLSVKERWRGGG